MFSANDKWLCHSDFCAVIRVKRLCVGTRSVLLFFCRSLEQRNSVCTYTDCISILWHGVV